MFATRPAQVLGEDDFVRLNKAARGNEDFEPLVIKAAYALGTMLDVFESVSQLLRHERAWQVTYRSAFGVFASAAELLGRCLSGNAGNRGSGDLDGGLRFVFPDGLITPTASYTVENLVQLRHFAAHGQAVAKVHDIDYQVLEGCPGPFGDAVEKYWALLISDEDTCDQLAQAQITPLQPSRIESVWRQFRDGSSAGQLFYACAAEWAIPAP